MLRLVACHLYIKLIRISFLQGRDEHLRLLTEVAMNPATAGSPPEGSPAWQMLNTMLQLLTDGGGGASSSMH